MATAAAATEAVLAAAARVGAREAAATVEAAEVAAMVASAGVGGRKAAATAEARRGYAALVAELAPAGRLAKARATRWAATDLEMDPERLQ